MLMIASCSSANGSGSFDVLDDYVEHVNAKDVDGAMELRCSDGRVETADWEQLLNEIGRLEASAGQPFEVVDLAEVHDARLLPIAGKPLREIRFRLHTQDGNSRPIHVVTVIEDGRERLCGYSVEESFHVRDRLGRTTIESGEGRIADLQSTVEAVEQTFTGAVAHRPSRRSVRRCSGVGRGQPGLGD